MPIRFATEADIPGLLEVARRMHALTRFKNFEYNEERVTRAYIEILSRRTERYLPLVAIGAETQVVGGLLAVLERNFFSGQIIASVMQVSVLPEARMGGYAAKMLRAFEGWAKNRGAIELAFGVNSGLETGGVGRLVRRMGFCSVGENFSKSL